MIKIFVGKMVLKRMVVGGIENLEMVVEEKDMMVMDGVGEVEVWRGWNVHLWGELW